MESSIPQLSKQQRTRDSEIIAADCLPPLRAQAHMASLSEVGVGQVKKERGTIGKEMSIF